MSIYLVDFENVHDDGLEGIKGLTDADKVIIFYGTQIKSIPFDRHVELMNTKAHVEYFKTKKIAKNYLDFQLTSHLGYLIGKGEKGAVHIISKDTGYDSVVDYWKGYGIKIDRKVSIQEKKEKKTANAPKQAVDADTKNANAAGNVNVTGNTNEGEKASAADLSEAYRKKVRAAVKEDKLSASSYTTIYRAIVSSEEKQGFNRGLVKSFGQEKGNVIYGRLKEIFTEYRNRSK